MQLPRQRNAPACLHQKEVQCSNLLCSINVKCVQLLHLNNTQVVVENDWMTWSQRNQRMNQVETSNSEVYIRVTASVEELNIRVASRTTTAAPKGILDTLRESVVSRGPDQKIDIKDTLKRPLTGKRDGLWMLSGFRSIPSNQTGSTTTSSKSGSTTTASRERTG